MLNSALALRALGRQQFLDLVELPNSPSAFEVLQRDVLRKIRQVGLTAAIQQASKKVISRLQHRARETAVADEFDSIYGTDTAAMLSVGALDVPTSQLEHINRYQTLPPGEILAALRRLQLAHEQFVFIDVGCGKGRALLLASLLPFREIIGVEISKRLVAVTNRNLELFRDGSQLCHSIRVVCADATNFDIPLAKLVFYFYNPFGKKLTKEVASRIEDSLRDAPRDVYVVYHQPVHREVWDGSSVFHCAYSSEECCIYEFRPTAR